MYNYNNKSVDIYLLGVGNIGCALLKIIDSVNAYWLNIKKIASSTKLVSSKNGLNPCSAVKLLNQSREKYQLDSFLENISSNRPRIFVDCTASEVIAKEYCSILEKGFSIVTANKIANTLNQEYYYLLREKAKSNNLQFRYETNVGGGLPIISTIKRLIETGDQIISIEGILSGTLSYIFSQFNEESSFTNLLKAAKRKGYTEPDPRNDLSGIDVARKILILARETGEKIEFSDIMIDALLPMQVDKNLSVKHFFNLLEKNDKFFIKKYLNAYKKQNVLRVIGSWSTGKASVGLKEVSKNSPFFYQKGRENFVVIKSQRYKDIPIVIRGHGAGASVTAAGVFYDIKMCCV